MLVALSYGSYTVVDVFVTNVESVDVYVAALLLSAICTSMIFMALIFGKLSRVAVYRTSFSSVIVEALGVPLGILILLWSVVVGWHAYAYFEWGIISHYDEVTLRENYFIDIPSWVGPVRHLVIALAFSLVIWLSALVLCKKRIRIVSLRTLLLLSIIAILTLNGRRMILNVLVVCGFVYVVARGRAVTLFSMSNLMKAATALVVLVFFSNVYQVARSSYLQHSALGLEARKIDLIDALQNFEKTAENLKMRIAVWRFHYWIMERQLGDLTDVMDGGLMWRGGVSAVPRVLYPEKSLVQEEVLICAHYRGMCPRDGSLRGIDYPQTMFSVLQADFGILFPVLVPLVIMSVLLVVSYLGRKARFGPANGAIYLIVFGLSANFLLNVEQSVGDWFIWMRNVAMVIMLIQFARFWVPKKALHRFRA